MIIILLAFCYCFLCLKQSLTLTSALHSIYYYCFKIYSTGVNFIKIYARVFRTNVVLAAFFSMYIPMYIKKAAEMMFVRKMRAHLTLMKLTASFPILFAGNTSPIQATADKKSSNNEGLLYLIICISYWCKVQSTLNFRSSLLQLVLLVGY